MVLTIILWTRRRVFLYNTVQQFATMDNEKSNESFTTMTAAIKTWGAHTEPPKHRIETAAPIILQVAPTMTAGTRPHSFAVPLQLFADHNLL